MRHHTAPHSDERRDRWDQRYAERRHQHVGAPRAALEHLIEPMAAGHAVDLGAGSGRHSVWLASLGWQVTAVDFSRVGLAIGQDQAVAQGVEVDWVAADVRTWSPPSAVLFDLVLVSDLHLSGVDLARTIGWLRPGGHLVVIGRALRNLTDGNGGPDDPALLYTVADLRAASEGLDVLRCEEIVRRTDRGNVYDALLVARRVERLAPTPAMPEYAELAAALLDSSTLVRAVVGGSMRNQPEPTYHRVELRYVDLKAGRRLHVEAFDATQAHTSNYEPESAAAEVQRLLAEPYGHWHVETTSGTIAIRVNKKGRAVIQRSKSAPPAPTERAHDRAKNRWLKESDPVFAALGVATRDGQIKPTRRDKFTQVQDFLASLEPVLDAATAAAGDGPLHVVDLGCGNAYLTFAAYRYLTQVRGLTVRMTGVDSKAQSREHNSAVAESLGAASDFEFVEAFIGEAEIAAPPHLVMALHACDTATDDALAQAVRWSAPVLVTAPCCHHDIQRQLDSGDVPPAYRLVARHGILRERMADVLTDTFRAALLRQHGYRAEVMEFVDSKHTPRNALIRAVRTGAPASAQDRAAYQDLRDQWQVEPRLEVLLREHPSS
ncbi:methyltransferase [Demetria terragena]|uniref:methyltransferase n=1 Tax=Demetria terragena TaxID=63959 RepID=UPI00036015EE|nr:methyltransferase [Demetria terragena]